MERKISWWHIFVTAGLFGATLFFSENPAPSANAARFLAPPPEYLELFTFGFPDTFADSLWLRWIQDSDTCQTFAGKENPTPLPAQTGEFSNPRHKVCDNSWSFKMLDQITKIAPKFKMVYQAGPISLSVLVEDYEGAKIIFDRGVENFPDDWQLLFKAAYHYLYDRQDYAHAADLLARAQKAGGPPYLGYLAVRLYSKTGRAEIGLRTLEEYRKGLTDENDIAKVDKRIEDLKKQMNQ